MQLRENAFRRRRVDTELRTSPDADTRATWNTLWYTETAQRPGLDDNTKASELPKDTATDLKKLETSRAEVKPVPSVGLPLVNGLSSVQLRELVAEANTKQVVLNSAERPLSSEEIRIAVAIQVRGDE